MKRAPAGSSIVTKHSPHDSRPSNPVFTAASSAFHSLSFLAPTHPFFPPICAPPSRKRKGERGKARKGEGPRANWEKVQVLRICRGVGVVTSRVIRDEYRI